MSAGDNKRGRSSSSSSNSSNTGLCRPRGRKTASPTVVIAPPSSFVSATDTKRRNNAGWVAVIVGSSLLLFLALLVASSRRPNGRTHHDDNDPRRSNRRPIVGHIMTTSNNEQGQVRIEYELVEEGMYRSTTSFRKYRAIRRDTNVKQSSSPAVTVGQWARGLSQSEDNARRLSEVIVAVPVAEGDSSSHFQAVFWETPAVRPSTVETQPMEFILMDAPRLHQFAAVADPSFFAEHFQRCQSNDSSDAAPVGCVFESLGRDAVLISPRPPATDAAESHPPVNAAHLMSFLRTAPMARSNSLWKTVGTTYLATLDKHRSSDDPLWLSTSGMGVSYLHVRIDTRPKYYTYDPYKQN